MLTYSRFGQEGNLGNQLFQYATLIGLSQKYGCELRLPEWKYSQYFEDPPAVHAPGSKLIFNRRAEKYFHYTPEYWDQFKHEFQEQNVDMLGWLQSEKYWEHCKDLVKQKLQFKKEFKDKCAGLLPEGAFKKFTIAISVRRGDYVNNPNYELLPIGYYITALTKLFPQWRYHYNIILFSDDMQYVKHHFGCLDNAFFAEGCSDIEQLCLMSQCHHFIIANSTFSWWGAYLGEGLGDCLVVRPNYLFAGELLKKNSMADFYPKRWRVHDHKNEDGSHKRIPLNEVTFTIPVFYDHKDRRENVNLSIAHIAKHFDTNFIIGEQYAKQPRFDYMKKYFTYIEFPDNGLFHRTKMLNHMALCTQTPIIVNWDADNFMAPMQIWEAAYQVREGKDMVYPFNGQCARVPRSHYRDLKKMDTAVLAGKKFHGLGEKDMKSVGQAIFFNRESFIEGGMENEFMISYAPEDRERFYRFTKLGYKIANVNGPVYHLDHHIGENSGTQHSHFLANNHEYAKVKAMNAEKLHEYILTWPWVAKPSQTGPQMAEKNDNKKFVFIIPYRNRKNQLQQFLRAIYNMKLPGSFEVYVIEQEDGSAFNRAKLLNVGFLLTRDKFDYFVFHDVDMIPVTADYGYPDVPTHIATECSQFKYQLPFADYFGGVTLFNRQDYEKVNGHSNQYMGWGKEDDDMLVRINRSGLTFKRRKCRFESLPHPDSNSGMTKIQMDRNAALLQKARYSEDYKSSGISNCRFKIMDANKYTECTIVKVRI